MSGQADMVRSQWRTPASMRDAQGELRRVKATFRRSAMIGNPSTAMNNRPPLRVEIFHDRASLFATEAQAS
jgi:hypothetical protein